RGSTKCNRRDNADVRVNDLDSFPIEHFSDLANGRRLKDNLGKGNPVRGQPMHLDTIDGASSRSRRRRDDVHGMTGSDEAWSELGKMRLDAAAAGRVPVTDESYPQFTPSAARGPLSSRRGRLSPRART